MVPTEWYAVGMVDQALPQYSVRVFFPDGSFSNTLLLLPHEPVVGSIVDGSANERYKILQVSEPQLDDVDFEIVVEEIDERYGR